MNGQRLAVAIFSTIAFFHVLLRLWIKVREARHRQRGEVYHGQRFGQMVAVFLALWATALVEWGISHRTFQWWVAACGVALYLVSAFLQWKAFLDLGEAYSPDIEVRPHQPLVTTGLYGLIRHPLLVALILELLGIVLFLNAYGSAGLVVLVFLPLVLQRMKEEETILLDHFGNSYRFYANDVGSLFPKFSIQHILTSPRRTKT